MTTATTTITSQETETEPVTTLTPPPKRKFGSIRQRLARVDSKSSLKSSLKSPRATSSNERLNSSHGSDASRLPLDEQPFVPTHTFWVTPHGTREVRVLDLTDDISVPYTELDSEYKADVKRALKEHTFSPVFTYFRESPLLRTSKHYSIKDERGEELAQLKLTGSTTGETVITFPEDSPHCHHPISTKNKPFSPEAFTLNAQSYFWEAEKGLSEKKTLYRIEGEGQDQRKVQIGKYALGGAFFSRGGICVVDDREIDGLVACLTLHAAI